LSALDDGVGKVPGVGKLPGDILIKKENFSFYFPITTCYFNKYYLKCHYVFDRKKMKIFRLFNFTIFMILGINPVHAAPFFKSHWIWLRVAIVRDSRELNLAIQGAYRFR